MPRYVDEVTSQEILGRAFDATVRLVVPQSGAEDDPHATGFFYTDYASIGFSVEQAAEDWDERLWLITNRHVVWSDTSGPTRSLEICLRDPDYTFGFKPPNPQTRVHLDATYLAANAWVPNALHVERPDVAAIEMVDDVLAAVTPWVFRESEFTVPTAAGRVLTFPRKFRLRALTRDDCGDPVDAPQVGARVLTIGYPVGGVDEVTGIPVAKSGTIATGFIGGWKAGDSFLIDINQFPGASGSPIFTAPQAFLVFDPDESQSRPVVSAPALIGIHCGGQTYKKQTVGLGVAWSMPWSLFFVIDPELAPVTLAAYNAADP